jgi:hypothetical protein
MKTNQKSNSDARPLEELTSAEAKRALVGVEARGTEVSARLAALQPGGREHVRVLEAGTPQELVAIEDEARVLAAEARMIAARVDRLRTRERVAREEEERAAAPGRLAELQAGFDDLLDRLQAATEEAASALLALDTWHSEVRRLRDILGAESGVLTPEQVRRVGELTRARIVEEPHEEEYTTTQGRQGRRPAIVSRVEPWVALLAAPSGRGWDRLVAYYGGGRASALTDYRRTVAELIGGDRIDAVEDVDVVAEEVVVGGLPPERQAERLRRLDVLRRGPSI